MVVGPANPLSRRPAGQLDLYQGWPLMVMCGSFILSCRRWDTFIRTQTLYYLLWACRKSPHGMKKTGKKADVVKSASLCSVCSQSACPMTSVLIPWRLACLRQAGLFFFWTERYSSSTELKPFRKRRVNRSGINALENIRRAKPRLSPFLKRWTCHETKLWNFLLSMNLKALWRLGNLALCWLCLRPCLFSWTVL